MGQQEMVRAVDGTPLTPAKIALARVLAAWSEWDGTAYLGEAAAHFMRVIGGVLIRDGLAKKKVLHAGPTMLVEHARREGYLWSLAASSGVHATIDRQRGKLTVYREGASGVVTEVFVQRDDLVRGTSLDSSAGRTWEAVVTVLTKLGVVVVDQT